MFGDYINGIKIKEIFLDKDVNMIVIKTYDNRKYYNPQIIHSVLTKEKFRQVEDRLDDYNEKYGR